MTPIEVMKAAPADSWLNPLGHVADGQRELNELWGVPKTRGPHVKAFLLKSGIVRVCVPRPFDKEKGIVPDEIRFDCPLDGFPSGELKTKIMLLAP